MRITIVDAYGDFISGAHATVGALTVATNSQTGTALLLLPDGAYTVQVGAPGYQTISLPLTVAGARLDLRAELFLDQAFTVTVRPVVGSFVGTVQLGPATTTNSYFNTRLALTVPSGRHPLTFHRPSTTLLQHSMEILVDHDMEVEIVVLTETVSDPYFNPLPDAEISIDGLATVNANNPVFILPVRSSYPYSASFTGFATESGTVDLVGPSISVLNMVLYPDRMVTVTFRLSGNGDVAGGVVHLVRVPHAGLGDSNPSAYVDEATSAPSDATGRTTMMVPAGRYEIGVDATGHDFTPLQRDLLDDQVGPNESILYLVPGADVNLHISDANGPVPGLLVAFAGAFRHTDMGGTVRFHTNLGAVPEYAISDPRYVTVVERVNVNAPVININVILQPALYDVTFRVHKVRREFVGTGAVVTVDGVQHPVDVTEVRLQLPWGAHHYQITDECYAPISGMVMTQRGGVTVEHILRYGEAAATFVVTERNGPPAADLSITLSDGSDASADVQTTDAEGRAVFPGLHGFFQFRTPLGRYLPTMGLVDLNCRDATVPLTVVPATEWPVQFHLSDRMSGRPLAGISVDVGGKHATTDANGDARVTLMEGAHDVTYSGPQLNTQFNPWGPLPLFVPEGGTAISQFLEAGWFNVIFGVDAPPASFGGFSVISGPFSGVANGGGDVVLFMPFGVHDWSTQAWPGFDPQSGTLDLQGPGQRVLVPLVVTTRPLTMEVLDVPRGTPVQGAQVTLNGTTLTTGASGTATFSLPQGAYQWQASAPNHEAAAGLLWGTDGTVTVPLRAVRRNINVQVTDGANPIPLALVWIDGQVLGTDLNGQGSLPVLPGRHRVEAREWARVPVDIFVDVDTMDVNVPIAMSWQLYPVTFALEDERNGAALTTGSVTVDGTTVPLDADGHATFHLIVGDHTVSATSPDHIPLLDTNLIVSTVSTSPTLRLAPASHALTVRVTSEGSALTNADVALDGKTLPTDGNGSIVFTVPSGSHPFTVSPGRGYEPAAGVATVSATDATVDVVVQPSPRHAAQFTVTSGGGSLEGALVSVDGVSGSTAANGSATLQLLPGTHPWLVTKPGYQEASGVITVDTNGATVSADLTALAFDVLLSLTDGDPVGGATVTQGSSSVVSDSNGSALLRRTNGTYTATITSPDHVTQTVSFTVNSGPLTQSVSVAPTPEGLVRRYQQRGRTAAQTMGALQSQLMLPLLDAVGLLRRFGFDPLEVGAAMASVYGATREQAAAAMVDWEAAPPEVVQVLKQNWPYSPAGVALALHDAGVPAREAGIAMLMHDLLAPSTVAPTFKDGGYSASDAANLLTDVMAHDAVNAVRNLGISFSTTEVAAAMRARGMPAGELARAMVLIATPHVVVAQALLAGYLLTVEDLARALRAASSSDLQVQIAILDAGTWTDADFLAGIYRADLRLLDAVNQLVSRGSSESSIIQALFDAGVAAKDAAAALQPAGNDRTLGVGRITRFMQVGYTQENTLAAWFANEQEWLVATNAMAAGITADALASHLLTVEGYSAQRTESTLLRAGLQQGSAPNVFAAMRAGGYQLTEMMLQPNRSGWFAAQQLRLLGESATSAFAVLKTAYGSATDPRIWRDLTSGGYPLAAAMEVIRSELGLDDAAAAALLPNNDMGAMVLALADVYEDDATRVVQAILPIGASFGGTSPAAIQALKARFAVTAVQLATAYRAAGVGVMPTLSMLNTGFGLTSHASVIPILHDAGFSAVQGMSVFPPFNADGSLWKAAGFGALDFCAYFNKDGPRDARSIVYHLNLNAFSLHEVTLALSALEHSAATASTALQQMASVQAVGEEVAAVYMVDPIAALLQGMREQGRPAPAAVTQLEALGINSPLDWMTSMRDAGWPRSEVVAAVAGMLPTGTLEADLATLLAALQAAYGGDEFALLGEALRALNLTTPSLVASVLGRMLYDVATAVDVLRDGFGSSAGETLRALLNSSYRGSDYQGAVQTGFGQDPLSVYFAEVRSTDGWDARTAIANSQRLGMARSAVLTATLLSQVGYPRAEVLNAINDQFQRNIPALLSVLHQVYGESGSAAQMAALRALSSPPLVFNVIEALHALGTPRGTLMTQARAAGFSDEDIRYYISAVAPKDDTVAANLRSFGVRSDHAWSYLRGYTQLEAGTFMNAQGYSAIEIAAGVTNSGGYEGAAALLKALGFDRFQRVNALMALAVQRGSSAYSAAFLALHAEYLTGTTTLPEILGALAGTSMSLTETVALVVDLSQHLVRSGRLASPGFPLSAIAAELYRPNNHPPLADIADAVIAVPAFYNEYDKYLAIKAGVAVKPPNFETVGTPAFDVLVTLANNGSTAETYGTLLAFYMMSRHLPAQQLAEIALLQGFGWQFATVILVCAGMNLSEAAQAILSVYKPIILLDALYAVMPGALGAAHLADLLRAVRLVARAL